MFLIVSTVLISHSSSILAFQNILIMGINKIPPNIMLLLLLLLVTSIVSDSVQPHRWQPTRLHHPWDSPGKNTGVGCHFLLQCMTVKSESEVTQSCQTLYDPMDCNLPGSSGHGIFLARVLGYCLIAFSAKHNETITKPANFTA